MNALSLNNMNNLSDEEDLRLFETLNHELSGTILQIKRGDPEANKLEFDLECCRDLSEIAWTRLGHIVGQSTKLEEFILSNYSENEDIVARGMFGGLQNNSSIQAFRLYYINLRDPESMHGLAVFLGNNTNLRKANIRGCNLGPESVSILTTALSSRSQDTLKFLDLSGNSLSDGDLEELVRTLIKCNSLQGLWLESNGIGLRGCTSLASLLGNPQSNLRFVYLINNSINNESLAILLDSLATNKKVRTLDLSGNNEISREGWKAILKVVCNASCMEDVEKSNHVLSDVGMNDIEEQQTLHRVLGTDNANFFCAMLKVNQEERNKTRAIKRKIMWSHARGDLNIGDSSIHSGAFPPILSLFDKSNLIQYHDPPLPQSESDAIRLDFIYRIVKSNPDICQREIKHTNQRKRKAIEINDIHKQLASSHDELSGEVTKLRGENGELREENMELRGQVTELSDEIQALRDRIEGLEAVQARAIESLLGH